MSFKSQTLKDLETFFNIDEFAQEIFYENKNVLAIVDYLKEPSYEGTNISDKAQIMVMRLEVEEPKYGDMVVIDSKVWKVTKATSGEDGLTWILEMERDERVRFKS